MRFALEEHKNLLQEFLADMRKSGYTPQTLRCYEADINRLLSWLSDNKKEELNGNEADGFLSWLEKEGINKAVSINRKKISYGRYLEWLSGTGKGLKEKESVISYQFHNIHHLYREPGCLSREEVDRFLEALDREYESLDSEFRRRVCLRDSVMFELLFYHSLDIGELVSMEAKDVDLEHRMFYTEGKDQRRKAYVLYSDKLYRKLREWKKERSAFVRDPRYKEKLFLTKLGTPVSMKFLVTVFEKYRELSGIKAEATPQFLKHSMKEYAESVMRERG